MRATGHVLLRAKSSRSCSGISRQTKRADCCRQDAAAGGWTWLSSATRTSGGGGSPLREALADVAGFDVLARHWCAEYPSTQRARLRSLIEPRSPSICRRAGRPRWISSDQQPAAPLCLPTNSILSMFCPPRAVAVASFRRGVDRGFAHDLRRRRPVALVGAQDPLAGRQRHQLVCDLRQRHREGAARVAIGKLWWA